MRNEVWNKKKCNVRNIFLPKLISNMGSCLQGTTGMQGVRGIIRSKRFQWNHKAGNSRINDR